MVGGTKFTDGKLHVSEDTAGVILLRDNALLIGNTVFGGIDEIMRVADYLDDREYTEGYRKVSFKTVMIAEATVEAAHDTFGDVVCAAATVTAAVIFMLFNDLC